MKLPFKTKESEKKIRLHSDAETIFPLTFISKGFISVEEKTYILGVKGEKGTRSLEVGKRIAEIAETVAPFNGGDPNAVARAIIEFRDVSGWRLGRSETSAHPKFDDYVGHIGAHAQSLFDTLVLHLANDADAWDKAALATVMMRRALKNKELEFDPVKWRIEQAKELDDYFVDQLEVFYYLEQAGETHRHLKPIEGTDEWELWYSLDNYLPKSTDNTDTESTDTESKEEALEVAAGKS